MTTDYFGQCEDAVIALLRDKLPASFITNKTSQIAKSDDTILGRGFDYFAITFPGAYPTSEFAPKIAVVSWEIPIDLFSRYKASEPQSWVNFKAFRAEVFQLFVSYRTLQRTATIKSVSLRSEGEPVYFNSRGSPDAGPVFLSQRQVATVEQVINRTGGEYGST